MRFWVGGKGKRVELVLYRAVIMVIKTARPAALAAVGRALRDAADAEGVTVAERRAFRMLAAAMEGK